MLPLLAIGGVISAVASVAKGASWLADQLDSSKAASSAGGKADAKPATTASKSAFEATLAAQVAGQSVPVSSATPATVLPHQHDPDYDSLARMKAGVVAYNHVGERRGSHQKQGIGGDGAVARA